MALLEIHNITKFFGQFTAIDNVSIDVKAGEFFTLLGPSGCGKTTLLRLIAGFDAPDSGQILLDGQDMVGIPPEKRPIHTVFQNYALFPHMTVADNIAFPLKMMGCVNSEIKLNVSKTLDNVKLSSFAHRYPHELSGGQKQRVALARGLINRPRLLLLDEPLGALDEKLRAEMQRELISLQEEVGVTFIFITHAQNEALALSHRIAVMNQGNIEQIDSPTKVYSYPANRFVAGFIGKINMLDAKVLTVIDSHLTLYVADLGEVTVPTKKNAHIDDEGVIAIRPEHIQITHASAQNETEPTEPHLLGKVHDILYVGDATTYMIILSNGTRIEALLPNSTPGRTQFFKVGDAVSVNWAHEAAQFLTN